MNDIIEKTLHNINEIDWTIALTVVVVYVIVDVLYAKYTIYVTAKKPMLAANYALFIYVFGAMGVLTYITNPAYLIFVAIGSWLGTYFTVKWS